MDRRRVLIDRGICLRICCGLCIKVGICVLIEVDFGGVIRHRYGLSDIAPESDDAAGVAVIVAVRIGETAVLFVGGLEKDFSTGIVGTGLELELRLVFILQAVEPSQVCLLVIVREGPSILVNTR